MLLIGLCAWLLDVKELNSSKIFSRDNSTHDKIQVETWMMMTLHLNTQFIDFRIR